MLWCLYSRKLHDGCLYCHSGQSLLSLHCMHCRHKLRDHRLHAHHQQGLHGLLSSVQPRVHRDHALHCDHQQSVHHCMHSGRVLDRQRLRALPRRLVLHGRHGSASDLHGVHCRHL